MKSQYCKDCGVLLGPDHFLAELRNHLPARFLERAPGLRCEKCAREYHRLTRKASQNMTDATVICEWMESKPDPQAMGGFDWWTLACGRSGMVWVAQRLTLDMLHLVEARLTDEQWRAYQLRLGYNFRSEKPYIRCMIHADAPTKIGALAAVLRHA